MGQLNTYKSSGLCNDKAIDINLDEDGKIVMALKAPKRATKPSKSLNKTPLRKNFRRSAKAIQSQTAGKLPRRPHRQGPGALRGSPPLHEGPAGPGEEGQNEDRAPRSRGRRRRGDALLDCLGV